VALCQYAQVFIKNWEAHAAEKSKSLSTVSHVCHALQSVVLLFKVGSVTSSMMLGGVETRRFSVAHVEAGGVVEVA
jgi:hypothetical protein